MRRITFSLKSTSAVAVGLLLTFISGIPSRVLAQGHQKFPQFKRFALSDGLPDLTINVIFQDKLAFLWLGTDNGLVRYDGYTMITYKPDPDNPDNSISGRKITAICEDNEGNLWVGTEDGGLNRYNRKKDCFSHISSNGARFLHKDNKGHIWIINNELHLSRLDLRRINKPEDCLPFYRSLNAQPANNIIRMQVSGMTFYTFHEDRKGLIWFSTHGGLACHNPETNRITRFNDNPKDRNAPGIVRDICEDKRGTLWISTENGRLKYLADRQRYTFTSVTEVADGKSPPWDAKPIWKIFPDRKGRLWLTTSEELFCFEPKTGKVIYHINVSNGLNYSVPVPIHEDEQGKLWLISWGEKGGIRLLDPKSGKIQPSSLETSIISSRCEDRFGTLWIGTEEEGLLKRMELPFLKFPHLVHKPENPNSLSSNKVNVIYESPFENDIFWIGTENGLNKFDRKKNTFARFYHEKGNPNSLSFDNVTAICEDKNKILWIGTINIDTETGEYQGALDRYDTQEKKFLPLRKGPGLNNNWIHTMFMDWQGIMWIGTRYGGIYSFPPDREKFTSYESSINNPKSLNNNEISVIYEDYSNTIWIGTFNGGLNKLDNRIEKTFKPYYSPEAGLATITAIHEDHAGNFWIGTSTGGLHLFNREEEKTIKRFTDKEGLPNDFVNSILEDSQGYLWIISGGEFLSKLNPLDKEFIKHYDSSDGFWKKGTNDVALKSQQGAFLIGGRNGFHIFFPGKIKKNDKPPRVVLTGFRIFDRPVPIGDNSPLKNHISVANEIILPYHQNDISFEFATIHTTRPDKNRCFYQLENYDQNWRKAGTTGTAIYNNLPAGGFTFKIKGASSYGVWSQDKTVKIIIKPPFWKTLWFYILVCFTGILILAAVYKMRVKHLLIKERSKNLEEQVAKRTAALEGRSKALKIALDNLKRAKDQLIQSEKMAALGNLTAGIAHEIKNPLNFVVNFAEVSAELSEDLQEELGKDKEKLDPQRLKNINEILGDLNENLSKIQGHGSRIDAIIDGMLLHSRGKKDELKEVDLNDLIKENSTLVYHSMRAKNSTFNVKIEYDLDESIGTVRVVPQDLSRAFLNIAGNACYAANEKKKEAPPGFSPTVAVKTKSLGDKVEIRIRDNGEGIPKADLKRIFTPYFTTKPVGEGTGLGLSIARDIIKRGHKGEIRVESTEGEFTEFIITIPKSLTIEKVKTNSQ